MSTAQKTQQGEIALVKFRSGKEILERQVPTPKALQHGLLYSGSVVRIVVEPEEDARQFGLLLACTVAVGADLGPFAKGPGTKVAYVSGSGGEAEDLRRLHLAFDGLNRNQQEKFLTSFTMYHCGIEEDDQIDLTDFKGRTALEKSIPSDTKVVFIDFVPAFFPMDTITPRDRKKLDCWYRYLTTLDMTIVVFDVESKKRSMLRENRAQNTIYLTHDATAPVELGGGHLLHRRRVDDTDSMPKCVSFWYTEIGGKLSYGFSVPDSEDLNAPRLTKKLERQIKVELMRKDGMSQKTIAEELKVHAATICRDCKEIDKDDAIVKTKGPHGHLKQQGVAP